VRVQTSVFALNLRCNRATDHVHKNDRIHHF
jgi:hypothetical protein